MPVGVYDGDSTYVKGGTDDTNIGNASDRLKVNSEVTNLPTTVSTDYGTPSSSTVRTAAMLGVGSTAVSSTNPVWVVDTFSSKLTYSASVVNLVSASSATDIFTISGSASKTVTVLKISIDGLATTGGNFTVNIIKRSTANSGGTSTTPTAVPHDSNDAAATAVVRAYTANPTLGTAVGTIRSDRVFISGGATTASIQQTHFFGELAKPIVLRGTAQSLSVNLNGVTINTPSLNLWVEWTEE